MNLLFLSNTMGLGGGEIWIINAAKKLKERGHHVSVSCPKRSKTEAYAIWNGLTIYCYHRWLTDNALSIFLAQMILEEQIDVICATLFHSEAFFVAKACQLVSQGIGILRTGLFIGLNAQQLGYGQDYTPKVIVPCYSLKEKILDSIHSEESDRICVIYNGVDIKRFHPNTSSKTKQEKRNKLGIAQNCLLLTAIGHLGERKGYQDLLLSAKAIVRYYPNAVFFLVGAGLVEPLKARCAELEIERHVIFAGFRKDIPLILGATDILIHPSHAEGLPNVVAEAMATGIPVIATNVDGTPELVVDGETGILVPPKDSESITQAALKLMQDEALRHSMGQKARERIEQIFDMDVCIVELESLFRRELEIGANRRQEQKYPCRIMACYPFCFR